MEGTPTQKHRFAAIGTPLGEDRLLLRMFSGREEMGQMFDYSLTLLDPRRDVDPDELVGLNVTVRVLLETDGPQGREAQSKHEQQSSHSMDQEVESARYFNGFIASLAFLGYQEGAGVYHARMVPWLWMLSRTSDCRSFQEKTVPQILEEVFTDFGFKDFEFKLTGDYQPKEFCVQYNETALNFVSRLMEHEGIYYWWKHDNGRHVMVITDDAATHESHPMRSEIAWKPRTAVMEDGYLYSLRIEKTVSTGAFALNDYNFKLPKDDLRVVHQNEQKHAAAKFEHFEYPGAYIDAAYGETLSTVHLQEVQTRHEVIDAEVTARAMASGYKFELTHAERPDQMRRYLIFNSMVSIAMDSYTSGGGGAEDRFDCQISMIPDGVPFRPARSTPKPVVRGPQPGLVVGPPGDEIYTDEFGRVKVHFYWDRRSLANAESSKWIRVSQPSAGGMWGFMSIPRIGQEVLVEFINGDPDQPIITGRVYNGEYGFPYLPPDFKERSTWKTNTSPGGGGFNELRFEDKAGEEQIFIHGQKDMDTRILEKNREWVGDSKHLKVLGDQFDTIGRDKHETTARHYTEEIKENHFTTVGRDDLSEIIGAYQLKSGENLRLETDGDAQIISGGATGVRAGSKVVIEAPSITLKGAGGFVKIDGTGVTIVGNVVLINSGGSPESMTEVPAKQIDKPKHPEEADDMVAGIVESTEGMGHALAPQSWEEQEVADMSARDGKPFEEEPASGGAAVPPALAPSALSDLLSDAVAMVKDASQFVVNTAQEITSTVQDFKSDVKDTIGNVRDELKEALKPVTDIANEIKEAIDEVKGAIKEAEDAVKEAKQEVNKAVDEVKGAVNEAVDAVKDVADSVKETADSVKELGDSVKTAVENAKTQAQESIDQLKQEMQDAIAPVKDAAQSVKDAAQSVRDVSTEVRNAATETMQGVRDAANEAIAPAEQAVKEARDEVRKTADAVESDVKNVRDTATETVDGVKDMRDSIRNEVRTIKTDAKQAAKDAANTVRGAAKSIRNAAQDIAGVFRF